MQERQLHDCADEGVLSVNQLLLPRHLTPSQTCHSMDGAQGVFPGGGIPNNTDYGTRQNDSFEERDMQAPMERERWRA